MDETDYPVGPDLPPPVERIAGRYRVEEVLGRGGHGAVFRAVDERTGEVVAVKRLQVVFPWMLALVRREVTALRGARLPGVVALLDDGEDVDCSYFIVMPLVGGRAFPGHPSPVSWEILRGPAAQLLACLTRVHFAGLVHRDLKPANVLVGGDGTVTLVDFGIARPSEEQGEHFEGTLRYAAPEQFSRLTTPCSDLYSVGLMLYEALTGVVPHTDHHEDIAQVFARRNTPPPPLRSLAPDVPAPVGDVIDRMIATRPEDRFVDLAAVMDALGLTPPLPVVPDQPTRRDEVELRALFAGPDRFLHLREDGARALFVRTGGDSQRVRDELTSWAREGRGYWHQDRYVLNRAHVEALLDGERLPNEIVDPPLPASQRDALYWLRLAWPFARVEHIASHYAGPIEVLNNAVERLAERDLVWSVGGEFWGASVGLNDTPEWSAQRRHSALVKLADSALANTPDHGAAVHFLLTIEPEQVPLARLIELVDAMVRAETGRHGGCLLATYDLALSRGTRAQRAKLAPLITIDALAQEGNGALHDALYWLGRADAADVGDLELLIRAALAAAAGELKRGRQLLADAPEFADGKLDLYQNMIRVALARHGSLEDERAQIAALAEWAERGDLQRGMWLGWRGNLAYREGDYARAADLHRRAAALKTGVSAISSLANSAGVQAEALEFAAAARTAERAYHLAQAARHASYEATALASWRSAAYRAGAVTLPEGGEPILAEGLDPTSALRFALTDAAHALRRGRPEVAIKVCERTVPGAIRVGWSAHRALLVALGCAAGAPLTEADVETCVAFAESCAAITLAIQIYGLLRLADDRPAWRARVQVLAADCPVPPHVRLDVLSLEEALLPGWIAAPR